MNWEVILMDGVIPAIIGATAAIIVSIVNDYKGYNNMFFKDANKFLEEKAYQNNDAKEDLRKQIEELKEVLKGYEKINKNNTLDYRIKGIEQHIEALEDLSYGRDLVSEWKEALKDDLREVRNIDEWEHEL